MGHLSVTKLQNLQNLQNLQDRAISLILFSQISKYETRRVNDMQVPKPRLELTRKSFPYKGAKVWNDIPNNIRNVELAALFKKQPRNYFMGQ